MLFTRLRKRFVSSLLVLGLLFSQFAVAAYACAKLEAPSGPAHELAQAAATPCEDMNMGDADKADNPGLCLEHCKHGQQTVNTVALANLPIALPVLLFAVPALVIAEPAHRFVQPTLLARTTAPPEYARSQRLRI